MKEIKQITVLWVSIILLVYCTSIGIRHVFRYNGFKIEMASVNASMQSERLAKQTYKRRLTAMTHPDFWELEIKEKLGYVKKGDRVIKGY